MQQNQYGRSMVEMLGVLSIIGMLSVGGYTLVGKAVSLRQNAQIIADATQLAASARKLACQYDDGYSSYTDYLYHSKAYPQEFTYNAQKNVFEGVNDVTYAITYDRSTSESDSDSEYFKMIIGNIEDETCIRLSSSDWGTPQSSGFVGLVVSTDNDEKNYITGCDNNCTEKENVAVAGTPSYPLSIGNATNYCNKAANNKVQIWYKGCH